MSASDVTAPGLAGRGRRAERPGHIPFAGWRDIVWRTVREIGQDDVLGVARSVAFSGMLALFPAMAAFVSIYGLFADVAGARAQLAALGGVMPADVAALIGEQMIRIAGQQDASLSLAFAFGLLLSIWSANAGMKAIFHGLNIAYEEDEKRGFAALTATTLAFTVGALAFITLATAAVVVLPLALQLLRLGWAETVVSLLRWPALAVMTMAAFAMLYRYGPSRERARWRWVSVGSVVATLLWLGGSALFSWYLANVADYNATYGSLGTVFGFLMWLWLSAVIVLVGAELNSEIEHQTARDSTTGRPLPLGERGATMADTIGEAKLDSVMPAPIARLLRRR